MSKGFLKFKQKMRAGVILRALLAGISLGVAVFAVQWLLAKLLTAQPDYITMMLTGGGAAAVTIGLVMVLFWPTDRRVAKKLDDKLQLNEKVQTMVAFRNEDTEMVLMQRENADSILQQIPTNRMRSKKAWMILIAPVLAVACLTGAIVVNAMDTQPAQPTQPDSSWSFYEIYKVRLNEVIEYVRTSQMDQVPKDGVVAQLQALYKQLESIRKESLMKEAVVNTISKIHQIVKGHESYHKLVDAMNKSASEAVKQLAIGIRSLDGVSITAQLEKVKASFAETGKADTAKVLANNLTQALTESTVPAEDPMVAALNTLVGDLAAITDETTDEELDAIFARVEESLKAAVIQPKTNATVETETINRLMSIFGISKDLVPGDVLDDFTDEELDGKPSDKEDEEEDGNVQGGIGKGENQFGSDDTIYDPFTESWVSYGEVLARYNSIMLEYVTGEEASDEIEQLLTFYYTLLADGSKKSD